MTVYKALVQDYLSRITDLQNELRMEVDYSTYLVEIIKEKDQIIAILTKKQNRDEYVQDAYDLNKPKTEIISDISTTRPERSQIILDCYGYVSGIRINQKVEVVLFLPNGQKLRRLFDSEMFIKKDIYYRDAPFRFLVKREGGNIVSSIIAQKPPDNYPGTVKMPEFDFSVLEKFESKENE
jgi:hypothetical protein